VQRPGSAGLIPGFSGIDRILRNLQLHVSRHVGNYKVAASKIRGNPWHFWNSARESMQRVVPGGNAGRMENHYQTITGQS